MSTSGFQAGDEAGANDVRLSVCIPCYAANANAIAAAAHSAAGQLPEASELIIVPSGPSATMIQTVDLPAEARVADPTVPPGLTRNWNRCLSLSQGGLIHILHSDDTVDPGFYAAILRLADRYPDAALYVTGFRADRDPPASLGAASDVGHLTPSDAARFFLNDDRHACGNVVLTRRVVEELGGFDETYDWCPDEEAYVRYASLGGAALDPSRLYVEHEHVGQTRHEVWRDDKVVQMYMRARAAGAARFGEDLEEFERRSTEHRIVSLAINVAEEDPSIGLAMLSRLAVERPETAGSPRVRLAQLVARHATLLQAARLKRQLMATLRRPSWTAGDRPRRTSSRVPDVPSWIRGWVADSAVLSTAQVLAVASSTVVAVLVARHLDPASWGVFAGLLGLALGLSLFVEFGLGTWLLRELSHPRCSSPEAAGRLIGGVIAINASVSAAVVVTTVSLAGLTGAGGGTRLALTLLILYGCLLASAASVEAYLRARRRVGRVAATSAIEKILLVALVLAAVSLGGGLVALGSAYLFAGSARVALAVAFVVRGEQLVLTRPPREEIIAFARRGVPFMLAAASMNLIPRLDVLLILSFSGTAAGYFALGERLLMPGLVLAGVISVSLYPFVSGGASRGVGARAAATAGAVGVMVCIVSTLLAGPLVPLLFGDEYSEAIPVARVLLLSIPFTYAGGALLTHLYSLGRERAVLTATVGASALGSLAIFSGQALGGPTLAAGGAVGRQALFLVALSAIAFFGSTSPVSDAAADCGRR